MNACKTILCGTDFSLHAVEAANVAAAIAARMQETLLLVHVVENAGLSASSPKILDSLLQRSRERLHAEAERLRARGVNVTERILLGRAHEKIVEAAIRSHARMIVVSSIGASTPRVLLVGSVAERIAESSPVPTLVVRNGPVLERWIQKQTPLRVLAGYDFSASSDSALSSLPSVKQIGPCRVTVAHIVWPPEQSSRFGLHHGSWWDHVPHQIQHMLERDLKERVALYGNDLETHVEPTWGRADLKLLDLARAENVDLILVGTHQRHGLGRAWLGSTSRGVLHHAAMSVLVVPKLPLDRDPAEIPVLRRVLLSTDLSERGNAAVPYAFSLLAPGGVVKLLCIIPPPEASRVPSTARKYNHLAGDAAKKLRLLIPPGAEARGIATEITVLPSVKPADAVCEEAERFGADIICVAFGSRSRVRTALLGSVAQSMLKRTRKPVLLVHPPEP
jgi:nucleotide-binding universal stress UspA family protein